MFDDEETPFMTQSRALKRANARITELEEANKRLRELLNSALYGSFFSNTSRREVIGKELDKLLNPTMEK